jgi:hypothetical protein
LEYPPDTVPVDLARVDPWFESDDTFDDAEIFSRPLHTTIQSAREKRPYNRREYRKTTLRELRLIYENNDYDTAIQLLRNYQTGIVLEESDRFVSTSPNAFWEMGRDNFVDYICALGGRLGLDAILPKKTTDLSYEFKFLIEPHVSFHGKHAQLGFDQAFSLLKIGNRPGETIFLALVPKEVLREDFSDIPSPGFATDTSVMRVEHSRIIMLFCAFVLARCSCGVWSIDDTTDIDVTAHDFSLIHYTTA